MEFTRGRWTGVVAGACLILLAAPGAAGARVRPGIEVGANVSSFRYDEDVFPMQYWGARRWRPSFTGGMTLDVPIRGPWALSTGVRYVMEGNRVSFDTRPVGGPAGEFRLSGHYLSVPVRAAWRPSFAPVAFVGLGPEVAILLVGRSTLENTTDPVLQRSETITRDFQRVMVALDAEAGVELPHGSRAWVVTIRYAHGLTGAAKKEQWASDWKTRGVEALLGMKW